jgi:hypothetical protein
LPKKVNPVTVNIAHSQRRMPLIMNLQWFKLEALRSTVEEILIRSAYTAGAEEQLQQPQVLLQSTIDA